MEEFTIRLWYSTANLYLSSERIAWLLDYTFFYKQPVYKQLALSVENFKQL